MDRQKKVWQRNDDEEHVQNDMERVHSDARGVCKGRWRRKGGGGRVK
jgi:hypothetical protein